MFYIVLQSYFVILSLSIDTSQTAAKNQSEALMLAQRTQEAREELKNKPRRIDPDTEDGFAVEDDRDVLPELTGRLFFSRKICYFVF